MERHPVKAAEIFPEECFQRKYFHITSHTSCSAALSIKITVAGLMVHCISLYIPIPLCKYTQTCTYKCLCSYMHSLLFILSPYAFYFLQLLSYTQKWKTIHVQCKSTSRLSCYWIQIYRFWIHGDCKLRGFFSRFFLFSRKKEKNFLQAFPFSF